MVDEIRFTEPRNSCKPVDIVEPGLKQYGVDPGYLFLNLEVFPKKNF